MNRSCGILELAVHEVIQWFGQVIPRLLASGLLLSVAALCLAETVRLWVPGPWVISPFSFSEKGIESKTEGGPFAQQVLAEVTLQNDLLRHARRMDSKGASTVGVGVSLPELGLPELPRVALDNVEINIQGVNLTSLFRTVSRWINPPREITGSVTSNDKVNVQVLLKQDRKGTNKHPIVFRTTGHADRESAVSAAGSQLLYIILQEECLRQKSPILDGMTGETFAVYVALFREYADTINAHYEERISNKDYAEKIAALAGRITALSTRASTSLPVLKLQILSDMEVKNYAGARRDIERYLSRLAHDQEILLIKKELDLLDPQSSVALLESTGVPQPSLPPDTSPAKFVAENEPKLALQRRWHRPIRPGISIGSVGQMDAGTICCLVKDGEGKVYALSSEHVLGGKIGTDVIQPGPLDGGTVKDRIGALKRQVASKGIRSTVGAIASIDDTAWDSRPITPNPPMIALAEPQVGLEVICLGRTSGATQGRIKTIHLSIVIGDADGKPQPYTGLFEVEGVNGPFSLPGDSGAPIVTADGKKLIGMLYAGSERYSYGVPIQPIMTALSVTPILGEEHSP